MNYGFDPSAPPADAALLEYAIDVVRRAGGLTRQWFGSALLEVGHKADGSPVTAADRAAERLIREDLGRHHPSDTIIGEEEGVREGDRDRWWCIDPIDGTKAFARGVPLYSSLLAFGDEHGVAIGVIYMPALDEMVAAGRGLGCLHNGNVCRVSTTATLADSYLSTSGVDGWSLPELEGVLNAGCTMRTWGDGYGHALVATGRMDAMVDSGTSMWDVAPLPVVITEAGGRYTALDGSVTIDRRSGVSTNGIIHDPLLRVLRGS